MIDPQTEILANLYVLGSLSPEEALNFEKQSTADPQLQAFVDQLRHDLSMLIEDLPDIQPGPEVWEGITKRIQAESSESNAVRIPEKENISSSWFRSILRRHWAALTAAALVFLSFVVLFLAQQKVSEQDQNLLVSDGLSQDEMNEIITPELVGGETSASSSADLTDHPSRHRKVIVGSKKPFPPVEQRRQLTAAAVESGENEENERQSRSVQVPWRTDPEPYQSRILIFYLSEPGLKTVDEVPLKIGNSYLPPDTGQNPSPPDESNPPDESILVAINDDETQFTDETGNLYEIIEDLEIEINDDNSFQIAINGDAVDNISLADLGLSLDNTGNLTINDPTVLNSVAGSVTISINSGLAISSAVACSLVASSGSLTGSADAGYMPDSVTVNAVAGEGIGVISLTPDDSNSEPEVNPSDDNMAPQPAIEGYAFIDTVSGQGSLILNNLPAAPAGSQYGLWVDDPDWESPFYLGKLPDSVISGEKLNFSLENLEALPSRFYVTEEFAGEGEDAGIKIIIGNDGEGGG